MAVSKFSDVENKFAPTNHVRLWFLSVQLQFFNAAKMWRKVGQWAQAQACASQRAVECFFIAPDDNNFMELKSL